MTTSLLKIKFIYRLKQLLIPQFVKNIYISKIRKTRIKQLTKGVKTNNPLRIVVGASQIYQKGWLPTEENFLNLLDITDWQNFFKLESIDAILAEHVWEHLTLEEGMIGAINSYKYLKKGGYMRIAVPDCFNPDDAYQKHITPPSLGHKVNYNYKNLTQTFEKAGFKVNLLEYYDENHQFHYNHWSVNDGMITRSLRFDKVNFTNKTIISSVLIDAIK